MTNIPKFQLYPVLLSLAALSPLPAAALSVENGLTLEEVTVTARRHVESLQDAPLAVSALSGDALRDIGITNLADITELIPNLQVSRPSRDVNLHIRGIGPTRGAGNITELSVGVYIDDVFLLKPQGQLIDLAEVESVQVLRGPQGTLFGKNTTGGALVITTVKPGQEFAGFLQLSSGNGGRFDARGTVNAPLNDTLFSKLTISSARADGFFQDPVHGIELSDENRLGALLQLRWLAAKELTVDVSVYRHRIRENMLAMGDCVVTNPEAEVPANALITPRTGFSEMSDFCEEVNAVHGGVAPYHDPSGQFKLDASQASLNMHWEFDEGHGFKSITAWRNQKTPNILYINPYAGFPSGERALEDGDSSYFSQEFQVSGDLFGYLVYTAGLYYMREESDTGVIERFLGQQGILGSVDEAVPAGLVAALTNLERVGRQKDNNTYAGYTQLSWNATPHLEVTAGMRYGHEQRKLQTQWAEALPPAQAYAGLAGAIPIPGATALLPYITFFDFAESLLPLALGAPEQLRASEDFDSFTPMLSVAYRFPKAALSDIFDRLMLYGSYTEGHKAGGFSDFAAGELLAFDEEEIGSFELGMKLDAWDNRLRVNAALFSMQYENMQLSVSRPHPDPAKFGSIQGVTNAAESRIDGAELEATWLPARDWTVHLSFSYADGKFAEFDDFLINPRTAEALALDRSDEALPSLPETSISLGIQYEWDTRSGNWLARVDMFHRDQIYWGFDGLTWDIPEAREQATTDSVSIFNARLNWNINERLSMAVWGKNLADQTYFDGGVGEAANLGHVVKIFSPPRRYGVDLRYQF